MPDNIQDVAILNVKDDIFKYASSPFKNRILFVSQSNSCMDETVSVVCLLSSTPFKTMEKQGRLGAGPGAAWHPVVLALTALLLFMNGDPASAGSDDAAFDFVRRPMRVSLPATVEWTTGSSTSTALRTGVIPVRISITTMTGSPAACWSRCRRHVRRVGDNEHPRLLSTPSAAVP